MAIGQIEFSEDRKEAVDWNDGRENVIEWLNGQDRVSCTVSQKRLVNQLKRLAEQYPDEVQIDDINKDGTVFAHAPLKWVNIKKPRQVEMSDERKDMLRMRLQNIRDSQSSLRDEG